MALTGLQNESLQFILFGGKGGVGKTTMAAATALELAKEKKVLIFTPDPAPSLTDSFGQIIGHEPTAVAGGGNLFAMEIDPKQALEGFKQKYAKEVLDILQQGTFLSNKETQSMFNLDMPGMDEMIGLMKIVEFTESVDYQLYIVDTAPTGHTLRLLMLSDLIDNWIKFIATLRWKYHAVARAFAGGSKMEKADQFLLEMKKTVKRVKALLQDPRRTEFVAVTIPEMMALSETEDLLKSLEQMHLSCQHIIINNTIPEEEPDSIKEWDRRQTPRAPSEVPFFNATSTNFRQHLDFANMRRTAQEKYLQEARLTFATNSITEVFLQPTDIRGIPRLQQLGTHLFSEATQANTNI